MVLCTNICLVAHLTWNDPFILWKICDAFECVTEEKKLDILINNAGASWIAERKTVDGFESIFATNHLGMRLCISFDG